MSEYNEYVVKAAEYLDEYAKKGTFSWLPVDWRNRIDLVTLDMGNVDTCILGQLHSRGWTAASSEFITHDRNLWYPVDSTFSARTREWANYIKGTRTSLRVDSVWGHRYGRDATVKSLLEIDGVKYVAYMMDHRDSPLLAAEQDFLAERTEIVKLYLKKGDEIKFKNYTGSAMFYWCSDDLVIRVENSEIGHSNLKYYTGCHGTASKGNLTQASRFEKIANA